MRAGHKVLGGQLPTLRLMEVVIHHVDLDAGYTFAETDPEFVRRAIANSVGRIMASNEAPSVTLRSSDGDTWSIGGGAQEFTGTNAAILLWLTRGNGATLSGQELLPTLPSWG